MLVSQETINAIYEIIGESFTCNRLVDRMVSVMNTKYACNKSSKKIHLDIAHAFPLIADSWGEILEAYNVSIEYASTPEGKQDYESVEQIIADLNDTCIDYQSMAMAVAKVAFENNDIHVYSEVLDIIKEINKIVGQTILLKDKIEAYKGDTMSFDNHIDSFWLLG